MSGLRRPPAPHLVATAFCLGIGLALPVRVTSPLLPALALAACVAALALGRERAPALAAALLLTGWWWGSLRVESLDSSLLLAEAGRAAEARLVVTGPSRHSEFSVRVPVRVVRFGSRELGEPARLEIPPKRAPPQGAMVEAVVTVHLPRPADRDDGFDERGFLHRQGVQVVLRAAEYRIVGRRGGLAGVADSLRRVLARSFAPGLEGERRAVIAGVVLGEDEALDAELRDRFRASGLYHLLAVSGQNVAYVIAGVLLLAWVVGVSRSLAQAGALAAVAGYVAAVGWQPSVVRAGVAGGLASLAWLAARPSDRWYFLLVGASVLLAWNPYSLHEPGFQLSFGAVAAIFLLVPSLERLLTGYPVPRRLAQIVALTAACGAATAPVLMSHFGTVPLFSIPSNVAAAPVVAPLLGLALGAAALEPVLPGAASALAWVNGWLAAYLAACARFFGGLPHNQLTSWAALGLLAVAVAFGALFLRLPPPRGRRAAALAALAAVVVAGWRLRPAEPPPPPSGLRLTVLDVGQGDAMLLQVPEGAVLVDQGPPEARVAEQLLGLGVRRLEALVMTHPSRDNIGGAEGVLKRLEVGVVLDPALPFANPYGKPALAEARRRSVPVRTVRAGQLYRIGDLRLHVLWPAGRAFPGADPNDHVTVIRASYGKIDALLPADGESNVTLPLRPEEVEILKVAHHGSADAGLPNLLALVRPRIALVSVGAGNDYGHPAPSTLAALARVPGLDLYRTDRDGRITLESDGTSLVVRTER